LYSLFLEKNRFFYHKRKQADLQDPAPVQRIHHPGFWAEHPSFCSDCPIFGRKQDFFFPEGGTFFLACAFSEW
jgi:hypothetical protein